MTKGETASKPAVVGLSATSVPLTQDAARVLTDEVKADAAALWAKLLELYEGKAHSALGYSSWGAYYEAEFDGTANYGYRLLKSARVMEQLPIGNSRPSTESVARELVPVLRESPAEVEEVWAEVVEEHGPAPTAVQVREHVQQRQPVRQRPALTEDFRSAIVDLDRSVGRLGRTFSDDRITRNKDTLRGSYLHDLYRIQTTISELIASLEER